MPLALNFESFLKACQKQLNPKSKITWISKGNLSQFPLWKEEKLSGFYQISGAKARGKGLKNRPIEETIADTHNWLKY